MYCTVVRTVYSITAFTYVSIIYAMLLHDKTLNWIQGDQYPKKVTEYLESIIKFIFNLPAAFLRTDPPFLLRFLRARKFRVGDAFLLLCHYFEYRQRHRELFRGLNVGGGSGAAGDGETGIQTALLDGLPGVLAERDPCGRPLIILLASNWDHAKYAGTIPHLDSKLLYCTVQSRVISLLLDQMV